MGHEEGWRTLSARVSEEEHDRYSELARLRGMSLSAFVREAMSVLYPLELFEEQKANLHKPPDLPSDPAPPPPVAARLPDPEAYSVMGFGALNTSSVLDLEDGLAAAFASLDDHDAGRAPMGTVHGTTPGVGSTGTRHGVTVPGGPPVRNDEHPCRHLNIVPPAGLTRGDCQGSCRAQHGRPCHWPAAVAAHCTAFRPIATGPHKLSS
jgi:hypothetical protein